MPRITAPTVAEHRARRRQALLAAALDLLVEQGVGAVTPAAVGAATGLARSSVYQYFASTDDLLQAAVEGAFPPAQDAVLAAMAHARTPREQVEVYLTATMRLATGRAHRAAAAIAESDLPEPCRARLQELHRHQATPLVQALTDLGATEPVLTAQLLGGLVEAARRAIDGGEPVDVVCERTLAMARAALA
jgi:AcrR family transcriptional regulator